MNIYVSNLSYGLSEDDLKDYLDGVKDGKLNKDFLNELKFFN